MNKRLCLTIAQRIHAGLLEALGQGIDVQRMVADALYARDVLLVCDAVAEFELASLAAQFRTAALAAEDVPRPAARASTGFSPSRWFSSLFGPPSTIEDKPALPPPKARGWSGHIGETHK
jgi:hypothetical protein